ncbi:MAG: hypothetical protein K2L51_00685, partial [Clostridiales bacterium]|nr:hypothetical protein [Clostridiales bacterium]
MQNYGSAAEELAARQKRFIPINIIVLALCLVASITLMTLPVLSIDMGKAAQNIQWENEEETSSDTRNSAAEEDGSADDGSADDGEEAASDKTNQEMIMDLMRDELDFTIELKPVLFLRLARSADNAIKEVFNTVFTPEFIEELSLGLMAQVAVNAIVDTAELTKVSDEHVDGILDAIREAENGNEDKARADMYTAVVGAAADLEISWTDDMDANFDELFTNMMEKGKNESGVFSTERMISAMLSDAMNGDEEGEEPKTPVYTYDELIDMLLESFAEEVGDAGKYISYAGWAVFGIIAFPARLCALLGLLALVHI